MGFVLLEKKKNQCHGIIRILLVHVISEKEEGIVDFDESHSRKELSSPTIRGFGDLSRLYN